ncbi:XTP/dITP diphosphohydrolase [Rubritalea squalenifaciens DSM 18772]|uniref:dITP/XTP pyrophosphatase n=1 Tax=Rubritalea squalenifaciens DSM 18772 TaxID=1123071 RepID=A0A1M6DTS5_9BACT|nr:RdgB/HAM1 family non-canonical purine NTP pyrophosphatase [Rubritalea squalenifaciens]SHI76667.1 XTP/dITP diphosphohydrolase [Rubritalea squalenifaciens DSM 18772]
MKSILIATRNAHKTEEIREMLGDQFQVSDLNGLEFPPVEETGTTFLENATLKAVEISKQTDELVISDDSGLEVDALDGEPGVYSSRYGGEDGNDQLNNAKLMEKLSLLRPDVKRSARFRCVMVIARNGQRLAHFSGSVEGRIIDEKRGDHGFGYDPLFIPDGHEKTFAELDGQIKNSLSHRSRALTQVVDWLSQTA